MQDRLFPTLSENDLKLVIDQKNYIEQNKDQLKEYFEKGNENTIRLYSMAVDFYVDEYLDYEASELSEKEIFQRIKEISLTSPKILKWVKAIKKYYDHNF